MLIVCFDSHWELKYHTFFVLVNRHSTSKCFDWAKDKFHKLGLSNVTPKLTDMQSLDHFSDGSFDLVVVGYGLAHSTDPQSTLNEVHRVLKPGGSLLSYVWEQLPADPGSDIILRHACVGPNPWHQTDDGIDAVGNFRCPVRTKKAMSLSKPHLRKSSSLFARIPFNPSHIIVYFIRSGRND